MALLGQRHPDTVTTESRIASRKGRLYLDIARNSYAQTAVAPYSVRALPGAPVSMPIDWSELDRGGLDSKTWTIHNVFRRLGQRDDPWSGMSSYGASVKRAAERLEAIRRRR